MSDIVNIANFLKQFGIWIVIIGVFIGVAGCGIASCQSLKIIMTKEIQDNSNQTNSTSNHTKTIRPKLTIKDVYFPNTTIILNNKTYNIIKQNTSVRYVKRFYKNYSKVNESG